MKPRSTPPSRRRRGTVGPSASHVVRVTVSLPPEVFESGENERATRGLTRSEYVTGLYRDDLERAEQARRVARYAAAYREHPESDDETWVADHSGALLLGEVPDDRQQDTGG